MSVCKTTWRRKKMATTFDLPTERKGYDFPMEVLCSLPHEQTVPAHELAHDMGKTIADIADGVEVLKQRGYQVNIGMRRVIDGLASRNTKSVWLTDSGWSKANEDAQAYWGQVHPDD
jgi:ribosome modulation factor